MSAGIEERVFVRFDDADVLIVKVGSDPFGVHEVLGVDVAFVCDFHHRVPVF